MLIFFVFVCIYVIVYVFEVVFVVVFDIILVRFCSCLCLLKIVGPLLMVMAANGDEVDSNNIMSLSVGTRHLLPGV